MELEEFKKRINEAMGWAREQGIYLTANMWGVRYNDSSWFCSAFVDSKWCVCPAGALLLKEQLQPPDNILNNDPHYETIVGALGVEPDNLRAFVAGADGKGGWDGRSTTTSAGLDWYQFGNEIREEIEGD